MVSVRRFQAIEQTIHGTIAKCLGDVVAGDIFALLKIGYGAGNPLQPVIAAHREPELVDTLLEKLEILLAEACGFLLFI